MKPAAIPIKHRPRFRYEAGHHSNQRPAGFGTEDYLLGQQLWHQLPRDERGHFDAGKEKADHETVKTNASACRKRDQLPRDCGGIGDSARTVQDNLRRAAAIGLSWALPGELTDDALENKLFARNGVKQGTRRRTEPNWADLAVELKKPGVTLLILWEEYRGSHPDGYGYSRFCEPLRGFKQRLSPTMRQEHAAGDKVFVDYSGKKIPIVDRKTGEIREAEIFG
ncbi:transposase [Mesorhizobium sp. M0217]|uniref:transposase n=1 Tax=unclassified Mesorhizobium TaxID=325217 RepID=UPI00333865FC